jgi:hypothetical protein
LPLIGPTADCALDKYHFPLEGESQSRQAKADAVEGGRRTTKLRCSAAPGRFSTFLIY